MKRSSPKSLISKNWPLISIILLGFILRILFLQQNLHFGFDQGRDALLIRDMVLNKKPVLIGPTTALPGVFIGPFFYYFLLPFYLLGNWNPVYPTLFLATLSTLCIPLIYQITKDIFNKNSALLSAAIFATSKYAIKYARYLSNPSPLIPITILMAYLAIKSLKNKSHYLLYISFLAGISLQTELANAFFVSIAFAIFILINIKKYKPIHIFLGLIIFSLTLTPQIVFDYRHDHLISNAIKSELIHSSHKTSLRDIWQTRPEFIIQWLYNSLGFSGSFTKLSPLLFYVLLILIFGVIPWKLTAKKNSLLLLYLWLLIPITYYFFYTSNYGQFFEHYLISLFIPLIPITGYLINHIGKTKKNGPIYATIIATLIIFTNLQNSESFILPKNHGFSLQRIREAVTYAKHLQTQNQPIIAMPPHGQPTTYQYVSWWMYKDDSIRSALPVPEEKDLILIYEPDDFEARFKDWHYPLTASKEVIKQKDFGIISVQHLTHQENPTQ